jgi:hypothetical protein
MADLCSAVNCSRRIERGDKMVQVARGYYTEGAITPTLVYIDTEWHEHCYEGEIAPQSPPYTCPFCNRRIAHGAFVTYVTVGEAPEESYIRPERRGYELASIEHVRCPATRVA